MPSDAKTVFSCTWEMSGSRFEPASTPAGLAPSFLLIHRPLQERKCAGVACACSGARRAFWRPELVEIWACKCRRAPLAVAGWEHLRRPGRRAFAPACLATHHNPCLVYGQVLVQAQARVRAGSCCVGALKLSFALGRPASLGWGDQKACGGGSQAGEAASVYPEA